LGEIWRMTEGNRLQYDFFGWWALANFNLILTVYLSYLWQKCLLLNAQFWTIYSG
jgi:hypothetical protein